MSFIICYASAIVLRVINAFLGANTPDFWWYFIPASLVALGLSALMVLANADKVFRKPTKKESSCETKSSQKERSCSIYTRKRIQKKGIIVLNIYFINTRYLFAR